MVSDATALVFELEVEEVLVFADALIVVDQVHVYDQEVEDHTCQPTDKCHVDYISEHLENILEEDELEDLDVVND